MRDAHALVYVEDLEDARPSHDDAHHLLRVLRLRSGDRVVASDGQGRWRACIFALHGRGQDCSLEIDGPVVAEARPAPALTVAFALTKGGRPGWTVGKLTEIGVDSIVVFAATRSVVHHGAAERAHALDRWRAVARAAAAQSRRTHLPGIAAAASLAEVQALGVPLTLAEPGGPLPAGTTTAIAVGPEGGWTKEELDQVPEHVDLGPGILRAETAAEIAGALLCAFRSGVAARASGRGAPGRGTP